MSDTDCGTCIHAFPNISDTNDLRLKCHRYPPTLFVLDGIVSQTNPDATERCGEYKEPRKTIREMIEESREQNAQILQQPRPFFQQLRDVTESIEEANRKETGD